MTTEKQKKTVAFIERWLGIRYSGHIECYGTVSYFIGRYIQAAKDKADLYYQAKLFNQ